MMDATQLQILRTLRDHGRLSGVDIGNALGIWSGTLYAALIRLEFDHGLVESEWKARDGYPRTRLYSINDKGVERLERYG